MSRFPCPVCGVEVVRQRWTDDIGGASMTVETCVECKECGYFDHTSYGCTVLRIGTKETGYSYATPIRQQHRELKRFKSWCRHERRKRIRELLRASQ